MRDFDKQMEMVPKGNSVAQSDNSRDCCSFIKRDN